MGAQASLKGSVYLFDMLTWLRKSNDDAQAIADDPVIDRQDLERRFDRAMDAVGFLLRTFGSGSFSVDDVDARTTRTNCERWARHLVAGGAHPRALEDSCGSERPPPKPGVRDWSGVRDFFSKQRRREHDYVTSMHDMVMRTVTHLQRAFARDSKVDDQVREQVSALRHAADFGTLEVLRTQVFRTIDCVEESISGRKKRYEKEIKEISSRMRDLKVQLEAAKKEASTDPLTQLFNRASLDRHLDAVVQLSGFSDEPICLLMIDVDHFKAINDAYGHQVGDVALREVSDTIVRVASRRTDFVARYGGEEFTVILADTPTGGAERVCERILDAVRQLRVELSHDDLCVTVSIGIAELKEKETVEEWVGRADSALYRAKSDGRNRWVLA